ncbi:MAG: hypothetical protein ACRDJW_10920 [Thermomicrobiales bacterium]
MEGLWPFVQAYGSWIALGGAVVVLLLSRRHEMRCCAVPQPRDAELSRDVAAADSTPSHDLPKPAHRLPSATDLRAQLADLQARQRRLAQQIAALEAEPVRAEAAPDGSIDSADVPRLAPAAGALRAGERP